MTKNVENRLKDHNSGRSTWTKRGSDWKLLYFEKLDNGREARRREKYLKSNAGKEWLERQKIL